MTQSKFVCLSSAVFELHDMPEEVVGLEPTYPAAINLALAEARAGRAFAPFEPKVLRALSAVYEQGFDAWRRIRRMFKRANQRIPLHDLDRAMYAMVPTHAEEDAMPNYSVTIGRALAQVKGGQTLAPFDPEALAALAKLFVSDVVEWKRVRLQFKLMNKRISMRRVDRAVRRSTSCSHKKWERHSPYVFKSQALDGGELITYWQPLQCPITVHVPDFMDESTVLMPPSGSLVLDSLPLLGNP